MLINHTLGCALVVIVGINELTEQLPVKDQGHVVARLSEIIDNVRASESLYQNLEVRRRRIYRLHGLLDPNPEDLKTGDGEARYVYQNGLIYFKSHDDDRGLNGKEYPGSTLQGYDGQMMRMVEQNAVANIRDNRVEDPRLFRPHAIMLADASHLHFPLSVLLQGGAAVRSQPWFRDVEVTVRYEGDEVKDGLNCHRIRVDYKLDSWDKALGTDRRFIWLAVDRNYLPIRAEAYRKEQREDEPPIEIGRVDDLREIAPGVWFPFHSKLDVYDVSRYSTTKEHVVGNTYEYVVEYAQLDPHYDISLFRDIPIPDGAQVHVIQNGKTVRKYTQGGRHTQAPRTGGWQWLTIAVIACVSASTIAYVNRRRARVAR